MEMQRVRRKPMSEINVVPYIDVMLVLLVIFMVTAPMLMQGIDVDLPETTSDPLQVSPEQPPLIVSVDAFGAYYAEIGEDRSKPLELGELTRRVQTVRNQTPDVLVLVRGDEKASYGAVVGLMGALKEAGVLDVGLITETP